MENIIEMLKYAGIPTIITAILGIIQGSRMKKIDERAKKNTAELEYSAGILEQSDERVQQAIDDKNRMVVERDKIIAERDQAFAEIKVQRKAKQEWREKYYSDQEARHSLQLELKDAQIKANDERYYRCEVEDCPKRKPPRKRIQIVEKSKKQENGKEERKDDAARVAE